MIGMTRRSSMKLRRSSHASSSSVARECGNGSGSLMGLPEEGGGGTDSMVEATGWREAPKCPRFPHPGQTSDRAASSIAARKNPGARPGSLAGTSPMDYKRATPRRERCARPSSCPCP